MFAVFTTSFLAVFKVFSICAAGAWLARTGTLDNTGRSKLSRVILWTLLPALLFSKLSRSASAANLRAWIALPLTAYAYIATGFLLGWILAKLLRPPAGTERVLSAATAFGNSGYVPIPLVAAIAGTAALFKDDPGAADRGIAYISVYLVGMSPCLWGIAYPYLSGRTFRAIRWRQVLSPPVCGALGGAVVGAFPPLRNLLIEPGAPLRVLLDVTELAGAGAIPCSLLVLGANVMSGAAADDELSLRPIIGVTVGRLLLFPFVGIGTVLLLKRWGWIPDDPMFALVLMLEAAVPPATNLIVMCQLHGRGEGAMARILFWTYLAAVPALTVFVSLFLWLLR
ncbi:MAG: hypothetical protein GXP31_18650 [Kiritimatiellaeota bacterium]|nr:hypothetical protein [Kiritimatiellota bacterium]